jgi:hypothetical protein
MTYFYMNKGTVLRQDGGEPPSNNYVAVDPQGVMRYVKNGVVDQAQIIKPGSDETKMALNMLKYRKKKTKKVKAKRCKCK